MSHRFLIIPLLLMATFTAQADERQQVEFPEMMRTHMLTNMRDHLAALDEIATAVSAGEFDHAAEVAEQRLGMSSLDDHGATHIAKKMPPAMQAAGTNMHRAASRLSRVLEEGDAAAVWPAFGEVTSTCVACHAAFRVH